MKRIWLGIVVVGLAAGCAKRFVVISPDDPGFCDRCRCTDRAPECPSVLHGRGQCTLAELKTIPQVSLASLNDTGLMLCGPVVLYRELGLDYEGLFAFDAITGALVASRTGGGYAYLVCGGGYYANETKSPYTFVFPKTSECVALDLSDSGDGGK